MRAKSKIFKFRCWLKRDYKLMLGTKINDVVRLQWWTLARSKYYYCYWQIFLKLLFQLKTKGMMPETDIPLPEDAPFVFDFPKKEEILKMILLLIVYIAGYWFQINALATNSLLWQWQKFLAMNWMICIGSKLVFLKSFGFPATACLIKKTAQTKCKLLLFAVVLLGVVVVVVGSDEGGGRSKWWSEFWSWLRLRKI